MSTIDKNDPRLTAYALGELPQNEIAEIEAAIAASTELQREVEEIKEMTAMLEQGFNLEEKLELKDEHRHEIKQTISEAPKPKSIPFMFYLTRVAVPAAVALFVVTMLVPEMGRDEHAQPAIASEMMKKKASLNQASKPKLKEIKVVTDRPAVATAKPTINAATKIVVNNSARGIDIGYLRKAEKSISASKQNAKGFYKPLAKRERMAEVQWKPTSSLSKKKMAPKGHPLPRIALSTTTAEKEGYNKRTDRLEGYLSSDVDADSVHIEVTKFNTESYDHIVENNFRRVKDEALSTFSIDVDTASYANVRRFLKQNQLPPAGAVRIEEMINYFTYDYKKPEGDVPFSVSTDVSVAPWNSAHKLVRIGIKGKEIEKDKRPMSNLVFLLDVSGSMNNPNKLPLLQKAMKMLVEQLGENDRVSIVVYAGASGLVLPATNCDKKEVILSALERLRAGGSTNGAGGIQLAYQTAVANYIKGGINRVILATDGDFNVGTTNRSELTDLIEKKAKSGVFLSVLGFGMGNYKDSTLETLADKGNGNYGYIDTVAEAEKILVKEMGSTLITIAKDVKIQIDFNMAKVKAYRLIGYENRMMAKEHFNDDTKDAGEIGAGHTVTALYEVIPVGGTVNLPEVEPSKYVAKVVADKAAPSGELLEVRVRYKQPDADTSSLLKFPLKDADNAFASMSYDFRFATGVATFGMILRNSKLIPNMTLDDVLRMAESSKNKPYRSEFIELVKKASRLKAVR